MAEYSSPIDAVPSDLGRRRGRVERGKWQPPFPGDPEKRRLLEEAQKVRVDEHLNPLDLLMGGFGPLKAMFMGAAAKGAPLKRLAQAVELKAAGVPEKDIYEATRGAAGEPGISFGKDGQPRWEIEDYMNLAPSIRATIAGIADTGRSVTAPLGAFITDSNLWKNYPELASVSTSVYPKGRGISGSSQINFAEPGRGNMMIAGDPGKMRSAFAHEIQHLIQGIEGWALGGNPDQMAMRAKMQLMPPLERRLNSLEDLAAKRDVDFLRLMNTPTYQRIFRDYSKTKEALNDPMEQHRLYERLAGEVEARNTQDRLDLDLLTRALLRPEETEKIPRKIQLIRRGEY